MLIREHLRFEGKARLDGREELIRKLSAEQSATDEKLILHAYEKWGDLCVKHLIGDFAFAIRDKKSGRIFGARDHFGVKPFFYTHIGGEFQFSTTLNELRLDKHVSSELNEIAVGDYLLFGLNQDLSTTIFKDIKRLPPAHTLTITNNSMATRRYWAPENITEVTFRDPQDYVERFSDLLSLAVRDRLRNTDRVGISMSGGLDSTSLAAIAREHASVHGFAVVYDELIPDEERHFSTLATQHLEIPITHVIADKYPLFAGVSDQPEPFLVSPLAGQFNDLLRLCADYSPVAFTGYDGDAFMNEPRPPRLRSRIRRMLRKPDLETSMPEWIDDAFATRTNLKERWNSSDPSDPLQRRPAAMRALRSKIWAPLFEGYDSGATKLNLELRHPFIDVRLVEYLLALPAEPWCIDKHILRSAMKDQLPTAVLNRRKTPLAGDPALQLVRRASVRWLDSFEVSPQLGDFVNLTRRPSIADETNSDRLWASLRVYALNSWLNSQPAQMEMMMERKPESAVPGKEEEIKKPYHKPEVVVYGNIREITRNTGPKGNLDGGGGAAAGPKTGT